jgi:hypothetical protein
MRKTYWLDLLFLEPPPGVTPGLEMRIYVKGGQTSDYRNLPEGEENQLCIGHSATSARELEGYVKGLKGELDQILAEATRRDAAYHKKLAARRKEPTT